MAPIIRVARLTDRQILKLINAFIEELDARVSVVRIGGVDVGYESDAIGAVSTGKDIGAISSFNLTMGEPEATVKFRRGIGGSSKNIDPPDRKPSAHFDEITVDFPTQGINQRPDPQTIINARRLILKHTNLPSDGEIVGSAAEATDLLKLQFSRLNEQLLEVNTASLKRREQLEDEYADRRRLLEEELARHNDHLREKSDALDADHKARVALVEDREKQLDDRDHIHARRELRTHMTDAIATQLSGDLVPRNASRMRWSVFGLMIAGAIALGTLSGWSLVEFGRLTYLASLPSGAGTAEDIADRSYALAQIDRGFHWLVLARGFLAGAFSIGFLLYAISWLKGIYHDEVLTRRQLQRYATDLNRASWAIETIMEAKSTGDLVIPESVMAGVTRNLFEAQGTGKANNEASANALAELLRTSGKARFGPQGAEFELSSRGASRLADRIDQ